MAITALAAAGETIDIGSRIELFVDHFLIDRLDGVQLVLHEPRPAEKVLEIDRPWEGEFNFALAVWKDGDRYRMFYRALPPNGHSSWCIAESADGIQWMKPNFGLVEWEGSRANNFIQPAAGQELIDFTGLSISMNNRPGAPESERYIGIVPERPSQTEAKMFLWFSSDGVRWRKMQDEPTTPKRPGMFNV
jgi:hypothetical protein